MTEELDNAPVESAELPEIPTETAAAPEPQAEPPVSQPETMPLPPDSTKRCSESKQPLKH